jgi:hypothetical protein
LGDRKSFEPPAPATGTDPWAIVLVVVLEIEMFVGDEDEDAATQRVNRVIAFSARTGRHHFHAGQIAVGIFHPARP